MCFKTNLVPKERIIQLPCGQCAHCRLAKSRDWAIRAMHEAQLYPRNAFITLTYDQEHLPENQSISVREWQLFAKRLRKAIGPFRFLACGEYGDTTLRPHYHACVFGINFADDRVPWKQNGEHWLFLSETLQKTWNKGFTSIGSLTFDSAAYVARYVMKKRHGEQAKKRYERVAANTGEVWEVEPEFAVMSRRPGLGKPWFDQFLEDVYPDDYVVAKGQKFRPPKYYDQLLQTKDPDLLRRLKRRRLEKATEDPWEDTEERRAVKDKNLTARQKLYPRKI